jgi:hypothetical protein
MAKLTDRAIRAIKADGRYGDGRGLWFVRRGGSTTWALRWTRAGKAREMSFGPYPEIGLAEARQAALEARRLILAGADPIEARRASRGGRAHSRQPLWNISRRTRRVGAAPNMARNGKPPWRPMPSPWSARSRCRRSAPMTF